MDARQLRYECLHQGLMVSPTEHPHPTCVLSQGVQGLDREVWDQDTAPDQPRILMD